MSIAALGRWLVLIALACSSAGAVLGFTAGKLGAVSALRWTRRLAWGNFVAVLAATAVMEFALLTHDFSVSYVAHVGSRSVPLHITLISLWASLEGSILFWAMILALFTAAFTWSTAKQHDERLVSYALGVALAVSAFFAFLIAAPANPFRDTPLPIPTDGPGANPLLQNHLLMIVHPPALYLGYVGVTIPFAMGVAALMRGQLGAAWMASMRRWTLLPWGFLTAGIVLGGWWAYEVLGWGGYWAWDPVENASLLPWLTATAFLHSAMLQERRGLLKVWTIVLLLATFALTILGTFMTRSGVFNSVHSFTQSDIGPTLLAFLAVVLIGSVVLISTRMHLMQAEDGFRSAVSREGAFVLNNFLLVVFTFSVLVGTTFPLIAEAVRGVKISVGQPFFDQFALPLGVAIVFLMGVGPALPWGHTTWADARRALLFPVSASVVATGVGVALGARDLWPVLAIAVAAFAIAVALRDMVTPIRAQRQAGRPWILAVGSAFVRGRRRYGGQVVHIGVAIATVAIALSGAYQQSIERVLDRGQSMQVGSYTLRFAGSRVVTEPHRRSTLAQIDVSRHGKALGRLEPAMNHYMTQMNPLGTPAVRSGLTEDLYLSVMQVDPSGSYVGLRAYVNPAVPWLWIALGIMLFGCGLALWPARRVAPQLTPAAIPAPGSKASGAEAK